MNFYIWAMLIYAVANALWSPAYVGKTRGPSFPLTQAIGTALFLPVFGRALGWF